MIIAVINTIVFITAMIIAYLINEPSSNLINEPSSNPLIIPFKPNQVKRNVDFWREGKTPHYLSREQIAQPRYLYSVTVSPVPNPGHIG